MASRSVRLDPRMIRLIELRRMELMSRRPAAIVTMKDASLELARDFEMMLYDRRKRRKKKYKK